MTVSTIGTTGTYSTINTWEAAAPSGTLSAPWEGDCQNQTFVGGDGSDAVITISGNTVSSANHKILTTDTGASFADNANKLTNALKYNASNGAAITQSTAYRACIVVNEPFTEITKLQIKSTQTAGGRNNSPIYFNTSDSTNHAFVKQCILESTAANGALIGILNCAYKAINCLLVQRKNGTGGWGIDSQYTTTTSGLFNCTIVKPSDDGANGTGVVNHSGPGQLLKNCAVFGFAAATSGNMSSSSGFNATDNASAPGSSNQVSATYADQFQAVADATMDFRAK